MEGLVRTPKETDRAGHAHMLEAAEGGTCQDTQRNRLSEGTHVLEMADRGLFRTQKETD